MKKNIYLFLITLLIMACTSEPHYVVNGKIDGSDSIIFYLQTREAGKTITIDSAFSKRGSFKIKGGAVDYPKLVQLVAGNTRKRTPFYLENSKITITGSLDSLFKAKITGSKTQDEYDSLIASNKPLSNKYYNAYQEYQVARKAKNTERLEELGKQIDSIKTEMMNRQKNYVRNNPSSYVTPSILASLSNEMSTEEIESMIDGLDTTIASLPLIQSLKERLAAMKVVAVGKKAPDFAMNDINGNPVSLSSIAVSGLLLLDFWASWCNPCRLENPNVLKVYKEFHKKGFDVLGISLDQKKEDWLKAIADDKLIWSHVSDLKYWDNEAAKLYAVNSIPSNFLLDTTGTIIARNLMGDDLYKKVREVLGMKK
jgi:peroxiredoxin